jgi:hypothetical protein
MKTKAAQENLAAFKIVNTMLDKPRNSCYN